MEEGQAGEKEEGKNEMMINDDGWMVDGYERQKMWMEEVIMKGKMGGQKKGEGKKRGKS